MTAIGWNVKEETVAYFNALLYRFAGETDEEEEQCQEKLSTSRDWNPGHPR
jgi:hypothetical protein